jgi:excisionase family DNA binding protein
MDAERPTPDLLTADEAIHYLRLDAEPGDPRERLRNLVRRQGLPCLRRGKLRRFRRSELEAWLNGERVARRMPNPARQVGK